MAAIKKFLKIACVLWITILVLPGCLSKPDIPESEVEQKIFQLVNEHRSSIGLAELRWNEVIAEECRLHSKDMSSGSVAVGHDGFELRMKNILKAISFSIAGENVAFVSGYTNPAVLAVNEWLNSSEHLANIESDFNLTGVGVSRNDTGDYYITQIFVREENILNHTLP
jgi:uncharacterized protein YkwD